MLLCKAERKRGPLASTVLYLVGAALWTLATRRRPSLHVVSVATGPPTWTQQLSCSWRHSLDASYSSSELIFVVSVATGPSTWSSRLLSRTTLALLSEHSLLVVGLLFLVIGTVPGYGLIVSAVL